MLPSPFNTGGNVFIVGGYVWFELWPYHMKMELDSGSTMEAWRANDKALNWHRIRSEARRIPNRIRITSLKCNEVRLKCGCKAWGARGGTGKRNVVVIGLSSVSRVDCRWMRPVATGNVTTLLACAKSWHGFWCVLDVRCTLRLSAAKDDTRWTFHMKSGLGEIIPAATKLE